MLRWHCVLWRTILLVMAVPVAVAQVTDTSRIRLNQVGFLPEASKIAVVPNVEVGEFWLISADTRAEVMRGPLSQSRSWDMSGDTVKIADFSAFNKPGRYKIRVTGAGDSHPFTIGNEAYDELLTGAMRYYYFNRAGAPIEKEYAGAFARAAGHPDTLVYLHPSAASRERPVGTVLMSPKGWYDAGDYNKYVVNSGIATYTLLAALQDFAPTFQKWRLNIPESENALPDLLDEILWNLDWLRTMQDPHDGGVYHKLTTLAFTEKGMPSEQFQKRYMLQKSTAAALNFAAVMAYASRVLAPYQAQLPGYADAARQQAEKAWNWAEKNPKSLYVQPQDVSTGAYAMANEDLKDEWLWAAAELYAATGKKNYLGRIELPTQPRIPEWSYVEALGLFSLAQQPKTPPKLQQQARQLIVDMANEMVNEYLRSGYLVAMVKDNFRWGSNAIALNKAMVLIVADRIKPNKDYDPAARGLLDYVLGRNPTGYAYVTGFGSRSPQHPHHRVSQFDQVKAPVPGMLVGGPQPGWQDKCKYPSRLPAKSYVDDWCSFSTNEVAINWNAPLVYVLAALRQQ
jgi:endoglucanase